MDDDNDKSSTDDYYNKNNYNHESSTDDYYNKNHDNDKSFTEDYHNKNNSRGFEVEVEYDPDVENFNKVVDYNVVDTVCCVNTRF